MPHHRSRAGLRATFVATAVALVLALAACGSSSSAGSGDSAGSGNSAGAGSSASSGTSAGSGGSATTGTVHFAKTKFVFHSGLAFGAFHRYIWKPARAGAFSHPLSHKVTILKAGLAAAFIVHEVKLAVHDAQADPHLSKLVAPLTALENRIHGLPAQVKSGDTASLGSDDSSIGSIEHQSAGAGQPIQEQAPANV